MRRFVTTCDLLKTLRPTASANRKQRPAAWLAIAALTAASLIWSGVGAAAEGSPGLHPQGPLIKASDVLDSIVGPDADAREPAVACNTGEGQFLAVWRADTRVDNQHELFGQFLDHRGEAIGDEMLLAAMRGGDDANDPDVVYNPNMKEYMVVWQHVTTRDHNDIFGRRVRSDGKLIGDRFRISNLNLSSGASATGPSIAYSGEEGYLVVWNSNQGSWSGEGSTQVWGQRLGITGETVEPVGSDFQISDLGDGSSVGVSNVTYNRVTNQYMVVWNGDKTIPVDTNKEIYGQILNANGSEAGGEFQITHVTGRDDHALSPRVACNTLNGEYMVVYSFANDDEIFAQRFNRFADEIGERDFRISDKGAVGSPGFTRPNVIYNPRENLYLVAWRETIGVLDTFAQLVDGDGTLVDSQVLISDVQGGTSETNRDVGDRTMLAYNRDTNEYLAVWRADGPPDQAKDTIDEIFAQRLAIVVLDLPGDTDGDLDVDLKDYNNLLAQFGGPVPAIPGFPDADFDDNGIVDIADFQVLREYYGTVASPPASDALGQTTTPEPTTTGLLALGGLVVLRRRRGTAGKD